MKQPPNPRRVATIERPKLDPDTLAQHVLRFARRRARWQVGLEYELIGYTCDGLQRISAQQVQSLLQSFALEPAATATSEAAHIVAVTLPFGSITLEPGGQIEFSGSPARSIVQTEINLRRFLKALHERAQAAGIFFSALGFDPLRTLAEQHWIRKARYAIMKPYLRTRGGHAWNMMVRTAAIQTSIDYGDEADLARKYVLGNRAGPIVAAMFANSPFADGRPTGLKSTRYAAWLDTDPDRTGAGPGALDGEFDLRRYVEAVLQVPLFFVERAGELVDVAGTRLADIPDASIDDFDALLSMLFTEARVRKYVELRSADSGSPEYALALMAFWRGLTYESGALEAGLAATPVLEQPAYRALQMAVARDALATHCEGVRVLDVARRLLEISREGLAASAPAELPFLAPLLQNVGEDGVAPADLLLAKAGSSGSAALFATQVA